MPSTDVCTGAFQAWYFSSLFIKFRGNKQIIDFEVNLHMEDHGFIERKYVFVIGKISSFGMDWVR